MPKKTKTSKSPNLEFRDLLSEFWDALKWQPKFKGKTKAATQWDIFFQLVEEGLYDDGKQRMHNPFEHWNKGYIPTDFKIIRFLLRIGAKNPKLTRNWGRRLLEETKFVENEDELIAILDNYFNPIPIIENLTAIDQQTIFLGRDAELEKLITHLKEPYHWVFSIQGQAGAGKTVLAEKVAHYFLENRGKLDTAERFDAILWFSAKQRELNPLHGIQKKSNPDATLEDLFTLIAINFDEDQILEENIKVQQAKIRRLLKKNRTLLIIDNLEELTDERLIDFFLEPPAPTKIVVTTRHWIQTALPIKLDGLDIDAAQLLIELESEKKHLQFSEQQISEIIQITYGIPLAILWTIAQLENLTFDTVIDKLKDGSADVCQYSFNLSVEALKKNTDLTAYELLLAFGYFTESIDEYALAQVSDIDIHLSHPRRKFEEGLELLQKYSLIYRDRQAFEKGKKNLYYAIPLVRQYILYELQNNPDYDRKATNNWITWWIDKTLVRTEEYIGTDVFNKTKELVSEANDRIWFLNGSIEEATLDKEIDWQKRGEIEDEIFEIELTKIIRRHIQQLAYFDELLHLSSTKKVNYVRTIQTPGNIGIGSIGYHYLRHLVKRVEILKQENGSWDDINLYQSSIIRHFLTIVLIDRKTLIIQYNERVNGHNKRMIGIQVIKNPPRDLISAIEDVFQHVNARAEPITYSEIQTLYDKVPSINEEFAQPIETAFDSLLTKKPDCWFSNLLGLIVDIYLSKTNELSEILSQILKEKIQDETTKSHILNLLGEVTDQYPDFHKWCDDWDIQDIHKKEFISN